MINDEFIYKTEGWNLIGAAMEVHKQLGCGFLEKVYQEALQQELTMRGIHCEREKRFSIIYKGVQLKQTYIADFVCYDKIIVEIKAVNEITDQHRSQVFNYLKATGLLVGYILNFGQTSLQFERLIDFKNK
ncbi:MAG: GxxExxY protein [Muribaculaceae bacterium]|nr:GxxExxY protein [Muribaculaceae bacterium]